MGGKKLGVESICSTLSEAGLQMAPGTYYAAKSPPVSAREVRDAEVRPAPAELAQHYALAPIPSHGPRSTPWSDTAPDSVTTISSPVWTPALWSRVVTLGWTTRVMPS
ncbi:MAG: hypothetical protein JWM84_3001 [Nocardioides sp.]|nr:hypothetical protein [Nocardioides sp.]